MEGLPGLNTDPTVNYPLAPKLLLNEPVARRWEKRELGGQQKVLELQNLRQNARNPNRSYGAATPNGPPPH